jgi:hypothetical protein
MRLRIYYNEEGVPVPYGGVVESVDTKRGLKVLLDGFSCPCAPALHANAHHGAFTSP